MPIQVYERYELPLSAAPPRGRRGCQLWTPPIEERGELWNVIEWDFMRPSWQNTKKEIVKENGKNKEKVRLVSTGWLLKCDFRLPALGIFRFMHPFKDDEMAEFRYETPYVTIPDHVPGDLNPAVFTPALKEEWDAMHAEWTCRIGPMTLTCTKDIPDKLEMDNLGRLYPYRPTEIRVD